MNEQRFMPGLRHIAKGHQLAVFERLSPPLQTCIMIMQCCLWRTVACGSCSWGLSAPPTSLHVWCKSASVIQLCRICLPRVPALCHLCEETQEEGPVEETALDKR